MLNTKIILSILLFTILNIRNVNATNTPAEVENFDIRYYHPVNYGLKDLVFEVRVKNLLEKLNKRLSLGALADVYFKVYWMMPGKYKLEVNGLPKGFKEIKAELKSMIKNRLDFVIPLKLAPKIRSYSLTSSKLKSGTRIVGMDRTHTRAVNEIQLKFNRKGMLEGFKTLSPMGVNNSKFKMSAKGWSHNKWVVDTLTVDSIQGIQKTSMRHKINYVPIDGFGFPVKVVISTSQEILHTKSSKASKSKRELNTEILFSKYEVNTGKAQRYITQGKRN
ncbi:MAG: hypothetical protein HN576_02050 [Bacteriovoracaceae bacterium]|jgi:hypothetical protein|nr:hypothetical protein [Bacteriovoracaceae bacterium]